MTAQQLPEGWQLVKFGEIAKHISKRVEPSETELDIYVGLEHLDPDSLKIKRHGVPSDVAGQKLLVKKGQIIFGKRRAYQRKVAVADWDCICSAHAMVLEANSEIIIPEFLPYFMQSDTFMNRAVSVSEGSLSPTIKWKVLSEQKFSIPQKEQQKKIVRIQSKIRGAINMRESTLRSAKRLFKLFLLTSFSPRQEWLERKLSDLSEVKGGRQRSPLHMTGKNLMPYFRPANIKRGKICLKNVLKMNFSQEEEATYTLKLGDILLVEGGEAEDVGDSFFYDLTGNYCYQNTLIRVRANEELIKPRHLYWLLTYLHRAGGFLSIAAGTKIKHIGTGNTSSIKISIPPEDTLAGTCSTLDLFESYIRDLEKSIQRAADLSKGLLERTYI